MTDLTFMDIIKQTPKIIIFLHKLWSKFFKTKYKYYYPEYHKHLTIYPNGHGILIYTYVVCITQDDCDKLYFKIDLNDADKDFKFKSLISMSKTLKSKRFNELGFWYQSENNFITGFEEFYWSDVNKEKQDMSLKSDPKHMRWTFSIDRGRIENNKNCKFTYVMSIPNMFPITNGYFDPKKAPYNDYEFCSMCQHDVKVNNMLYTVSLESDVQIVTTPNCMYYGGNPESKGKRIIPIKDNNCLYNKYTIKCKKLNYNNCIDYKWTLKELEVQRQMATSEKGGGH